MIYAVLLLMCIFFIEIVLRTNIVANVSAIAACSKNAISVLGSAEMDDYAKEKAARENAVTMLKETALFVFKFSVALSIIAILYFLTVRYTTVTADQFSALAVSIKALIGLTIFSIIYVKIRNAGSK